MRAIGNRMQQLRKDNGLTQAEIAKICGTNQSTIARMESGQTAPTVSILLALADHYDVSMDYLCCRTEKPQGRLYEGKKPSEDDMQQFIEMCFDPKSPVSSRVKNSLLEILKEGSK